MDSASSRPARYRRKVSVAPPRIDSLPAVRCGDRRELAVARGHLGSLNSRHARATEARAAKIAVPAASDKQRETACDYESAGSFRLRPFSFGRVRNRSTVSGLLLLRLFALLAQQMRQQSAAHASTLEHTARDE